MNQDIKITNFNPNCVHAIKATDSMIRAICKITGLEWENVYTRLCERGLKLRLMPDDLTTVIEEFSYLFDFVVYKKYDKRAIEFILEHPSGSYIIVTNTYRFAVINGVIYDVITNSNIDNSVKFNNKDKLHNLLYNGRIYHYFVLKE